MKKFMVRILEWLRLSFSEEDAQKTEALSGELKKLEAGHAAIVAKSEDGKERVFLAHEGIRKASILGASLSKMQELRAELWRAQGQVKNPLEMESRKYHALCGEIELLTRPLREEILTLLDKYISEITAIKKVESIGTETRFVSGKGDLAHDVKINTISHNFEAVDTMLQRLIDFKREVRAMSKESHADILEAVKKFEVEANSIDVFKMQRQEVTQGEWQQMRASGVI